MFHQTELMCMLINEQIGYNAQIIVNTILTNTNNTCTLNQILLNLINQISENDINNTIQILNSHEYISITNDNNYCIINDINKDNILNILKYPRYLYLITMYYGKYGCEIAETILEKSIINQSNIISNNNNNNKSNTFTQMISDNILIPVQHTLINNNINYKLNFNKLNHLTYIQYIEQYLTNQTIYSTLSLSSLIKKILKSNNNKYELELNINDIPIIQKQISQNSFLKDILTINTNILSFNTEYLSHILIYHSIEQIINTIYTPQHIRILRYLTKTYSSSIKTISNHCSIDIQKCKDILNDLIYEQLITITTHNPSTTATTLFTNNIDNNNNNEYTLIDLKTNMNNMKRLKEVCYEIIYKIKLDLDNKLHTSRGRVSIELQESYINRGYHLVQTFMDVIDLISHFINENGKIL